MLETFTVETFAPQVGSAFTFTPPAGQAGGTLALTLRAATPLGDATAAPDAARKPFSLLFLGPTAPILPQQIYRVHHATIGTFDLFIVPIGATASNVQYEAIFT